MMPQGGGAFARLTVLENLQMGGFTVADSRDVKERIETALNEYPSLKRRVAIAAGSLSGGEQMMLAMARALVSRPRFILLDEPSAGLSPALVSEALDRARALAERGIGILMVEQDIREALPTADHLYIMAAGEMKFGGTPRDDLTSDQEIMNMYMGHQGIPASTTS